MLSLELASQGEPSKRQISVCEMLGNTNADSAGFVGLASHVVCWVLRRGLSLDVELLVFPGFGFTAGVC